MTWLRRRSDRVVGAVFGVATAFVLAGNLTRSFDFDEAVSVRRVISRGSPSFALTEVVEFNNHLLFSAWQSFWWGLGGEGEARQRIFPVLYGALAVGLLAGWLTRRRGAWAGLAGGLVMLANPMFVTQSRAVRGYSLSVLGATVAIVCLLEYVRVADQPGRRRILLLAGHAIGIVVAMGTHGFAGAALGPIGVAALVLLGRVDPRVVISWLAAAAGLVLVYVWTIADLLDTADQRGSRYLSFFGELVTQELLGREPLSAAIIGGLVVFGVLTVVMRVEPQPARAGTAVLVAGTLVVAQVWYVWQVAQPFDLYPRFFLSVLPLLAIAVAVAVAREPRLAVVLAVAVGLVFGEVRDVRDSELPLRDAGEVVVAASGLGWEVCAVGADPIRLYTAGRPITEVRVPEDPSTVDFGECGVFLRIGTWGRPLETPAAAHFAFADRIGPIGLYSQVPLSLLGVEPEA
ncbi:MAG: hypothetical protein AAGA90_00435 [Actinomycetota bacterium]